MSLLTPRRRDALVFVLALALLAAPLWVPALHVDDSTYHYESVAIETNGSEMRFASEPSNSFVGISDRIVCAERGWSRACAVERYVRNHTIPTGIYSGNPDYLHTDANFERYDYVYLNGTVYEAVYPANESVTWRNASRLDLGHRPVAAEQALQFVSVDAEEVVPPVRKAAQTGSATGYTDDVPDTPVRLGEGEYRRVYIANTTSPPDYTQGTERLLIVMSPLAGLGLLGWLRTRFDVTVSIDHTGR